MSLLRRLVARSLLAPPPSANLKPETFATRNGGPGAPHPSPKTSMLDAIERHLNARPQTPFTPHRLPGDETLAPFRQGLERLSARLATGDRVYFETSQARYLAILALAAPAVQPGCRVLDVGCSPGHVAQVLSELGCEVHGIDFSEDYLPFYPTDQDWPARLHVRSLDFEQQQLPHPDASFDLVLFTEVLEHVAVRRPWEILAELHRVLRPGGHFILTTPNFANISQILALCALHNVMWAPEIFYGGTQRHNREYVPHELVKLMEGSPFCNAEYYLMNVEHNWNSHTIDEARAISRQAEPFTADPLYYNTLIVRAQAGE